MTSQVVDTTDRGLAPESGVAAVVIVEMQEHVEGIAGALPLRRRALRRPIPRAWCG